MKTKPTSSTLLKLAALSAITVFGAGHLQAALLSENYTSSTIGNDATATTGVNAVIVDGTSTIGSGNAVQLTDPGIAGSTPAKVSYLEYNFVADDASEVGAISYSFDLYNTGAYSGATSTFVVGVGGFDASTGSTLNVSSARTFNLEFTANSTALKIRGDNSVTTSYVLNAVNHFTVFVNDSGTNSISYTDPSSGTQSLAANSGAVYLGNTLLGTVSFAGGYLDGDDAGLGRLGFYSGTSVISQFTLDNIIVTDIGATAIPEPSAFAALLGLGVLGAVVGRRRRA